MNEWTIVREGALATADTRTNLTTLGSSSTPGTPTTPKKAHRVRKIWTAVGQETPTAAAHGGVVFYRLWGDAFTGEQVIPAAGCVSTMTTAGETCDCGTNNILDAELTVAANETFSIAGEMCGVEATDQHLSIELFGD